MVCDSSEVEVGFVFITGSEIQGVGQGKKLIVSEPCSQALLGIREEAIPGWPSQRRKMQDGPRHVFQEAEQQTYSHVVKGLKRLRCRLKLPVIKHPFFFRLLMSNT